MIILLFSLAGIGLLLLLASRVVLMRQLGAGKRGLKAAVWLPLCDLVYLAGNWHRHHAAALCSVAGMALLVPLAGQVLWEIRNPQFTDGHPRVVTQLASILRIDLTAAPDVDEKDLQDRLWITKSAKVDTLTQYLALWHASLQSRRTAIATSPAEVVLAYNKEAEAYHALLQVAKQEKAALAAMPAPTGSKLMPLPVN